MQFVPLRPILPSELSALDFLDTPNTVDTFAAGRLQREAILRYISLVTFYRRVHRALSCVGPIHSVGRRDFVRPIDVTAVRCIEGATGSRSHATDFDTARWIYDL